MPFKIAACAAGAHELGKMIFPKPSDGKGTVAAIWASQGKSAAKIRKISKNLTSNIGNPSDHFP
jgi:hypothetical protein